MSIEYDIGVEGASTLMSPPAAVRGVGLVLRPAEESYDAHTCVRFSTDREAAHFCSQIGAALGLQLRDALMEEEIRSAREAIRERLAAYAHEVWAGWMRYQSKVRLGSTLRESSESWDFARADTDRWLRQMKA